MNFGNPSGSNLNNATFGGGFGTNMSSNSGVAMGPPKSAFSATFGAPAPMGFGNNAPGFGGNMNTA